MICIIIITFYDYIAMHQQPQFLIIIHMEVHLDLGELITNKTL